MPLGMLLLLFRQRQRKDKLRTNAFRADTVDIFSMCLDDFFYNGKSKSGALLVFSAGEVCLVETIPDLFDAVFWQARCRLFLGYGGRRLCSVAELCRAAARRYGWCRGRICAVPGPLLWLRIDCGLSAVALDHLYRSDYSVCVRARP